jgi:hypothetical protein
MSPEEEQRWIRDNWDTLWEFARRQYRKCGRGALIVDPRKLLKAGSALALGYALQRDIKYFRELVDGYDPEMQMVIEIARPGGGSWGYQVSRPGDRGPIMKLPPKRPDSVREVNLRENDIKIMPTGEMSREEKIKMLADNPNIRLLTIMSDNPDDIQVAQQAGFSQDADHEEIWTR